MTIHCLYNAATNALLGVSEETLVPLDGQAVIGRNRGLPDFSKEEWNTATLDFYTKPTTELTHHEFRCRFTAGEQELIDEFNATFEAHPGLTAEQKRKVRTGLKNFEAASVVVLSDTAIPTMLGLYTLLGLLAEGRAAEILA